MDNGQPSFLPKDVLKSGLINELPVKDKTGHVQKKKNKQEPAYAAQLIWVDSG